MALLPCLPACLTPFLFVTWQVGRGRYGRGCACGAALAALVGLAWWIGAAVTFTGEVNPYVFYPGGRQAG